MPNPNNQAASVPDPASPATTPEPAEPTAPRRPWGAEVNQLLQRAAALCSEHDVELDAFMNGAWSAYVEARPGLRDQLEEAQLIAQLDELRRLGRLGNA